MSDSFKPVITEQMVDAGLTAFEQLSGTCAAYLLVAKVYNAMWSVRPEGFQMDGMASQLNNAFPHA